MIRLSMNVIGASIALIKHIDVDNGAPYQDIHSLYRISDIDIEDILDILLKCKLLETREKNLYLSDVGKQIQLSAGTGYEDCIRIILKAYIEVIEPLWSNRIPYGRYEAITFMSKDEKSCFSEAGLLSENPDMKIVQWWDELSEFIRSKTEDNKNVIGRSGEQYTISYEERRTGSKPKWKSIDSNLVGYDILSATSACDNTPLLIEVKTSSEDMQHAFCHISSNEWRVAKQSSSYAFYLWNIQAGKKLIAVVQPDELTPHIPENKESGEWESVKIPFSCFSDKFVEWSELE